MKVLYYDCFSGISGDMNLGAMLDLGVDPSYLLDELKKIRIGSYEIQIQQDQHHPGHEKTHVAQVCGTAGQVRPQGAGHHVDHLYQRTGAVGDYAGHTEYRY